LPALSLALPPAWYRPPLLRRQLLPLLLALLRLPLLAAAAAVAAPVLRHDALRRAAAWGPR
jgi:hypothetical protein